MPSLLDALQPHLQESSSKKDHDWKEHDWKDHAWKDNDWKDDWRRGGDDAYWKDLRLPHE